MITDKTYPKPKPLSETEQAVADYLTTIEATLTVLSLGRSSDPMLEGDSEWEHDSWKISFVRARRTFTTTFHTGSGHRIAATLPYDLRNANPRCVAVHNFRLQHPDKAVAPCAATVLHSCLLDASFAGETFSSWCSNFGYDTDSRKARDTYDACQVIRDDLYSVFEQDQIKHLEELLQDY